MKKIILVGYMGCGKSTIGKLLSENTGMPYFDLDEIIEDRTQMSISDIFHQKGEIYFRKLEHQIFQDLMTNPESMVLSLGGGTPCYSNNHELLKGTGIYSFYLAASIPTLCDRLIHNKANRPLLVNKNEEELKEFIAKHLFDRSFYYHQAQFTVKVDDKTPESIVSEIKGLLA